MENKELFFKRLSPYHCPSEIVKIELAYTLAKYGHSHQTRKQVNENGDNIRYFEHPRAAAIILMDEAKLFDIELIIGCLMHDIFEDSKNVTPEMVEQVFGKEVCKILKTVSKCPKEGYLERFSTCKDFRPFVVKACDRLDNLRSMDNVTIEFKSKQIKETKEHYFELFERMVNICPEEYKKSCYILRDLIREQIARIS